jgi:Cu(I)/Ag(I) efflux system membrane fusion protein
MNKLTLSALLLGIGTLSGFYVGHANLLDQRHNAQAHKETDQSRPLYWVAPMDPNYRRDKPGKSPMGMDLIPVYETQNNEDKPGLVTITPRVEHNLGVRTQAVTRSPFNPQVQSVGTLIYNPNTQWQLNSRVSGWVETLHIKAEGEKVTQGQQLLSLYSPELMKAQDDLLNAYNLGNQRLQQSTRQRLQALGVSERQIKLIAKNRKVSPLITLYAPATGFISKLGVREGAYISPATLLVEAGALDEIWLRAELFESQAAQVTVGSQASMRLDSFPGQIWRGEVDYIYPALDPITRTLQVRVKFANPNEALKPNMYARVTLEGAASPQRLQIPREAVIYSGQGARVVMARGNGQYQSVRVRLGAQSQGNIEVLDGLEVGDKVVTSAQFLLDSESSLTAELSRMGPPDRRTESTQVQGVIVGIKAESITIAHQPVEAWRWPAMVMDFPIDSALITEDLVAGRTVDFEIEKNGNQFPIIAITPAKMSGDAQGSERLKDDDLDWLDLDDEPKASADHSQHGGH